MAPLGQAAPPWLADPANSRWIEFGPGGVSASNGLSALPGGVEGTLVPTNVADTAGALALRPNGEPGYVYLAAEPWSVFRNWKGESDLVLTVRYFDGGDGVLRIRYDSSDASIRHDPYPVGVWRTPDDIPDGQRLRGDGAWKTFTTRLPFAFFAKRLHGGDLRIEGYGRYFVLGGAAVTRVPKGQEPPVILSQALRVARAEGLHSFSAGARFSGPFVQHGAAPIAIEAEMADAIVAQQGDGVIYEPQASGGGAIAHVASASYRLTVATPGRYFVWQRGAFPIVGGWLHHEWLDGDQRTVMDGAWGPTNGWVWIRAGAYDLTAGEHTLKLNYCGGAKLDVIVLTQQDAAPDVAAIVSSYRGPTGGEIWTVPVKPFDVARWRRATFRLPANVEARCEYSSDGGKTWQALASPDDLAALPVHGGGTDSLQFHVAMKARDGKSSFMFGGGTLSYQSGPNDARIVENGRLKIEVDAYGLKSITDKRSGLPVARAASMHEAIVSLMWKKPGDATPFSQDLYNAVLEGCEVSGTAERPVLTLTHRLDNGIGIATIGTLLPNGQSEWQMRIDNDSDVEVVEFRFPVVTGIQLGGDPSDDWLFVPRCWGQVMQNVAGGGQRGDPAALRDHEAADSAGAGQLLDTGHATPMRWSALWDEQQGLYLGIEDPRYEDYRFFYGADGSGGATLASWQRTLVKPHSQWTSGTFRLALTGGGDWHEAADIYRDYTARTLKPNDVHPYIKWLLDAWDVMPAGEAQWIGWDMVYAGGENMMAAWRQMLDGTDMGYCGLYPYPSLAWGTTREFSQKLAVRRALGGFFTDYHNFHLWSAGYSYRPRVATFPKSRLPADASIPDDAWYRKAAAYNYDGSFTRFETNFPPYCECPMAMASREWRDWLMDWTMRDLAFGTDGRYYDQLNTMYDNGRLYPGFDTYGCWMQATLDILGKIRGAARKKNPYFTSSGEICNDVYGQLLDLHMTSGVWNRSEIFQYCTPRQIIIDGMQNGGLSEQFGGAHRHRFIWQMGGRFDSAPADKRLLALRRAVKSLLYDATFRDTVGVTVRDANGAPLAPTDLYSGKWQSAPVAGMSARWFLVNQGGQRGAIVNIINVPVRKDATCSIRTVAFGPIGAAFAMTLEGAWLPLKGRQEGDTFTFPIPESECASVVLAGQVAPLVEWNIEAAAAPGVTRKLSLKLTNPNSEPLSGSVAWRLPRGWKQPAPVAFGPITSGAAQAFAVAVNVPPRADKGRTDLWCDITTPSGSFSAYNLLVVNEPVVADFRGIPGTYHVWLKNLTAQPLTGTLAVSGRDGLTVSAPATFGLPPESEVRLPVEVAGQDRLLEMSEIVATVKVGRQKVELVRGVFAIVPNGGFEMDGAGDGYPDWWMCRKGGDACATDRVRLAAGAHSGKYCLRLDPPLPGERFTCAYPVNSSFKPNTKYRVSVWIKAASRDGIHVTIWGAATELAKGKTGPEWTLFEQDFVTPPSPRGLFRVLYNASSEPAYFDDFTVKEVVE
ncbi:MAG: NEW3 domain-containing protein [Kiritimatiellae bacterium]|nr:NEW3 domain-containing protein [Kiritimatiellia bacterium]